MSVTTLSHRDVVIVLTWNESAGRAIQLRVNRGVSRSVRAYLFALKRKLGEWGSDFINSVRRLRKRHSAPGQAPLKQTGNLEKSIQTNITHSPGQPGFFGPDIIGSIYTDVPYARALELGETAQVDQADKKYTRVRLVNPIHAIVNITPRPAWLPTFDALKARMLQTIKRG